MAIIPSPPSTSDAASSSSSSLLSALPPLPHDPSSINPDDPNAVALLQSTKERRRERNRLAAQKHRLRRSQRMTQLEQQVLALQQEKHALLTRLGVAPNPSSGPVAIPLANVPPGSVASPLALSATTPLSPASSYPGSSLGHGSGSISASHHPAPPSSATDEDDDQDHDPELDDDEEDISAPSNSDPHYSRSRSVRSTIDHSYGHGSAHHNHHHQQQQQQQHQLQHQRKRSRTGQPVHGQTQLQFVPLPLQIPHHHAHGHTSSQSSNSHSPPSSTHTPDPSSGSGSGPNSHSSSNKAHSVSSSTPSSTSHALQERIVELERWTEDLNGSLQDALDTQTRLQTKMKAQQQKFDEMMQAYAEESENLRREVKRLRGNMAVGVEEGVHSSSMNHTAAGPTTLPPVSAVTSGLAPLSPPAEDSRYGRILPPARQAAGYSRDDDHHPRLYTDRERDGRPPPRSMYDEREASYYERDVDMYDRDREPVRSAKPKPRLGRVWELDHPEEPPHSTTSYARHSHSHASGPAPMRWSPQAKTARPENDHGIRLA